MGIDYVPTVCPYCSCGCGIYLVVKDGKIIGQEPWKEHPINEGANCPKGKNAYHYLYSQDRLKAPLVRKNDNLTETTWDEALDLIVSRLKEATPESAGFLASCKNTNEESYVIQKFSRIVMKTNNVECCCRLCHSPSAAALGPAVGSPAMQTSQPAIEMADCIFLAGVNIKETFPLMSRRVLRAKAKGAKVICTDPRKSATARDLADIHLQLKPGTDVVLINAMMSIILAEGLENKEFITSRTAGFDDARVPLSKLDLKKVEEITGVPAEKFKEAAVTYARAKRGCILYNQGICEQPLGVDNVKALANLALLTGNIGKPGTGVNSLRGNLNGEGTGDMGSLAVFYPGLVKVSPEIAEKFARFWGVESLPGQPGLTYMEMLYKCPYLYLIGADPMMVVPDTNNLKKALQEAKFLVVQDIFLTETAKLAQVVLPAATWVEREGTHTYVDRRVQKINKVIEPPGEARPDWWIICQLAERMGYKEKFNFNSAGEIFEEIRKYVPTYQGITYERLKKAGGIHWPCPGEDQPDVPTMYLEKFNTPDGMGHFQPAEYKPPPEPPDAEYPYVLTTGRSIFHFDGGSMSLRTPKLVSEVNQGCVEVNTKDALQAGVKNRDKVILATRRGSIEIQARVTDNVPPGLLFATFHFPDARSNTLTNPALVPGAKCAGTKVCAAKMEVKK